MSEAVEQLSGSEKTYSSDFDDISEARNAQHHQDEGWRDPFIPRQHIGQEQQRQEPEVRQGRRGNGLRGAQEPGIVCGEDSGEETNEAEQSDNAVDEPGNIHDKGSQETKRHKAKTLGSSFIETFKSVVSNPVGRDLDLEKPQVDESDEIHTRAFMLSSMLRKRASQCRSVSRHMSFLAFCLFLVAEYLMQRDRTKQKTTIQVNEVARAHGWDYTSASLRNVRNEVKLINRLAASLHESWGPNVYLIYDVVFGESTIL